MKMKIKVSQMKGHTAPPGMGCCIGIEPDVDDTGVLNCCLVKDGDCIPYCTFWFGKGLLDNEGPVSGTCC